MFKKSFFKFVAGFSILISLASPSFAGITKVDAVQNKVPARSAKALEIDAFAREKILSRRADPSQPALTDVGADVLDLVLDEVPFKDVIKVRRVSKQFSSYVARRLLPKIQEIEGLLNKFGPGIPLPDDVRKKDGTARAEISRSAPTQELWVKVTRYNPSLEKRKKDCPGKDLEGNDEYHEVIVDNPVYASLVNGKFPDRIKVGMCKNFPVELFEGKAHHGEEIIFQLNRLYILAGLPDRFRPQTIAEYAYADTVGGTSPKLGKHAELDPADSLFLGNFIPYWLKGELPQLRAVTANYPNSLGFIRSGLWEIAREDVTYEKPIDGIIGRFTLTGVGGSYIARAEKAESGVVYTKKEGFLKDGIRGDGPVRIVRTLPSPLAKKLKDPEIDF